MVQNHEAGHREDPSRGFTEALADFDTPAAVDQFGEWLLRAFEPDMRLGFTIGSRGEVQIRRLSGNPPPEFPAPFDFGWVQPLFSDDCENGDTVSLAHPDAPDRLVAMASAMHLRRSVGYVVLLGDFPRRAESELSTITRDAAVTMAALDQAVPRVADVIQQAERDRLSRDLHDSLSQSLWSLSMLSEAAHGMVDPSDPLKEITAKIARISLAAHEQMRGLLSNLRTTEPARSSTVLAIEDVATSFRSQNSMEVVVSAQNVDLEPDAVMALRRIAEEALNNVGRHSYASVVLIHLDDDPVTLRIADDGIGFGNAHASGHLGLRIMKERAAELGLGFRVGPSSMGGAEIVVSQDLERVAPFRYRPVRSDPPSLRPVIWALAACVLLVAGLFGSLAARSMLHDDARLAAEELDLLTVAASHVAIARAAEDELLASVLVPTGLRTETDVAQAAAAREVTIDEARAAVEPLLDTSTRAGVRAGQVIEVINGAENLPSGERRIGELLTEIETLELMMGSLNSSATPVDAVANLAVIEITLGRALFEAVIADQVLSGTPAPEFDGAFSSVPGAGLQMFGGVFGPNSSTPLSGGIAPDAAAAVYERQVLADLNALLAESSLWETDRWLRSGPPTGSQSPVSLERYVRDWTDTAAVARAVVDERFDAVADELAQAQDVANRRAAWLTVGALLAGLAALASLGQVARVVARRVRFQLHDQRLDPLTGVGNRSLLSDTLPSQLASSEFGHHLVVTIDMDRFKLVNDTHGHAFGDRMLRIVALGLWQVVTRHPGVVGEVVRLGGDEFLVSLHSAEPIAEPIVRRHLEQMRQTLLSTPDGDMVRCAFSLGMVSATGSPDLASVMAASDLAAYDDKAQRTRSSTNATTESATSAGN